MFEKVRKECDKNNMLSFQPKGVLPGMLGINGPE